MKATLRLMTLHKYMHSYIRLLTVFQLLLISSQADVILAVTCSIRENAEKKIWNRLDFFKSLKKKRSRDLPPLKIGLLGKDFTGTPQKIMSQLEPEVCISTEGLSMLEKNKPIRGAC